MVGRSIKIDQALHGYSRGHKELATSIELDGQSRTTMLMMSDLLAISDLQQGEAYITIYPLRSASRHVIARTWAAGKTYRPGSVWTHSLILDYQALTLINDLTGLRSLFRMPDEGNLKPFSHPLAVNVDLPSKADIGRDDRIRPALQQLYGEHPRSTVELQQSTPERDETLTLALWRQMWPSLRRDFSALTNRGEGQVSFDSQCTLRFMRYAPPLAPEYDPVVTEGLDRLEADLPLSGPTMLRQFLARYGIEAPEPRRVATALAALQSDTALPATDRLEHIRRFAGGAQLPRLKKDILGCEFAQVDDVVELVALVRSVRNEVADIETGRIVSMASAMSPTDLANLILATGPSEPGQLGTKLFTALANELPIDLLASIVVEGNRSRMVKARPELLTQSAFWPSQDAARAAIIQDLPSGAITLPRALALFGDSIGPLTVSVLMRDLSDVHPEILIQLLLVDNSAVRDAIAGWITSMPGRLRRVADHRRSLDRRAIETLAGAQVGHGRLPEDPVLWAYLVLDGIGNTPSRIGALNSIAYLCALALDGEPAFQLAAQVYDPLHRAVRSGSLSRAEQEYLTRHIATYSGSWSLSKALVQSALTKWPATASSVGAFGLARSDGALDEMVDELFSRLGQPDPVEIANLQQLPERARMRIRKRLAHPKSRSKKGANSWSWLFGE